MRGISWLAANRLASQEGLCYMEYVATTITKIIINYIVVVVAVVTYSIQHITSWEANRFEASQEIPRILWNPIVHYRIHIIIIIIIIIIIDMAL